MESKFKVGELVYYADDDTKHPYLIHEVRGNLVSLGLTDYPDTEQDYFTNISDIRKFTKSELLLAKDIMNSLLN